jgi:hypothetical protein
MKIRYIYTVIREHEIPYSKKTLGATTAALVEVHDEFKCIQDEAGECLYGGGSGEEIITVEAQMSLDGKHWRKLNGDPIVCPDLKCEP